MNKKEAVVTVALKWAESTHETNNYIGKPQITLNNIKDTESTSSTPSLTHFTPCHAPSDLLNKIN